MDGWNTTFLLGRPWEGLSSEATAMLDSNDNKPFQRILPSGDRTKNRLLQGLLQAGRQAYAKLSDQAVQNV